MVGQDQKIEAQIKHNSSRRSLHSNCCSPSSRSTTSPTLPETSLVQLTRCSKLATFLVDDGEVGGRLDGGDGCGY